MKKDLLKKFEAQLDALNSVRNETVKAELKKADSKLAELYAAKVSANESYKKEETRFLLTGGEYCTAQRALVRVALRAYAFDVTRDNSQVESFLAWFDGNNIGSKMPIVDTCNKLSSYVETTYKDYLKGVAAVKKTKEERESEKASKAAMVAKLATLSIDELTKLLDGTK